MRARLGVLLNDFYGSALLYVFHRAEQRQSTKRASGGIVVEPGSVQEGVAGEIQT